MLMAEGMRWFGPADTVTLREIRQAGATAVFSALHEVPYGEAWPAAAIAERRGMIAAAGLAWHVAESVPVSEAIKTRTGDFERHLENYRITLERLGRAGIGVVVYNFMPLLDWVRTDLAYRLADGSETLRFDPMAFAAFELFALRRAGAERDYPRLQVERAAEFWSALGEPGQDAFTRQTLDLFPGVKLGLTLDDFRASLARYAGTDAVRLREHLRLFLEAVVPAAEAAGVRLALHPDDPPFPVLGLPRIVGTAAGIADILALHASPAHGLCFCTGSLGVRPDLDLVALARACAPRVHAVHLRSIEREPEGGFHESDHLGGVVDMPGVVRALLEEQDARRRAGRSDWRLCLRPDHGRRMLDDFQRAPPACPGYSLAGRLRGLAELRGLQHGIWQSLPSS